MAQDEIATGYQGQSVLNRFSLGGKSALVTGGGQGIGRALAHALGEAGASLIIADLNLGRAESVAEELKAKGVAAHAIGADVSDQGQVRAMVGAAVERYGRLDIAINNAGVNFNSAAEDTSLAEWDTTFAINLRGVFICCQEEAKLMLAAGSGVIVNMASMASLKVPHPQKQAVYNTAKAGVAHLTRSLACEWASRGVRVNALSPGLIQTELLQSEALKPLTGIWIKQVPMDRFGQVSDLQSAIVFLACEGSSYMTGHNLVLDGGQSLW